MALGAVLQSHFDSKLFGNADGGTDIVGPVGMGLQGDLALKDRDQSFHLHIILGLLGNVIAGGLLPGKIIPGGEQHFTQLGGGGHPGGITFILVATLGVFTKGTFHGHRVPDHHVIHAVAIGLDGKEGAAQHIGAAWAGAHGGNTANKGLANAKLLRIEAVNAAELGGDNVVHLVVVSSLVAHAVVVQSQMAVGVNKAGIDTQSDDVYDFLTSLGGEVRGDFRDPSVFQPQVSLIGFSVYAIVHHAVFNQHTHASFEIGESIISDSEGKGKRQLAKCCMPWYN